MGPINSQGTDFIKDLGHRISRLTDDPGETTFLFQRLSVAIQRFNSVYFFTLSLPSNTIFANETAPRYF